MTGIAIIAAATTSAALLALGLVLAEQGLAAALALLLAPTWWLASRQPRTGAPLLLLIAALAGAGYASVRGAPTELVLGAGLAAIIAADLYAFLDRIRDAEHVDPDAGLEIRHLRRVSAIGAVGLALGLAATRIEVDLGLAGALALGLLAIIGFSRAVRYLREQQE